MPSYFLYFLVEMGFCHIGQAGLELLTSRDPPTSASQSTRITGVRHHALKHYHFFFETGSRDIAQAGVQGIISTHCNLHLLGSSDLPASASLVAAIIGLCHHARLMFVFLRRDRV